MQRGASVREAIACKEVIITGTTTRTRSYLHTTAAPALNVSVLVEQWLVHITFPFSIFYLERTYGPRAVQNQLFHFRQSPLNTFLAHLYWIIPIIFFVFREHLNEHGITNSEFVVTMMAGGIYRLVVASKYASLTKKEYLGFLQSEDEEEVNEQRQQMQLLTGWMTVDVPQCVHEAKLAAHRVGLTYDGTSAPPHFTISASELRPTGSWSRLLGMEHAQILAHGHEEESPTTSGTGDDKVQEVDLCDFLGVVTAASHPTAAAKVTIRGCLLGTAVCACLPNLARVCCPSLAPFITRDDDESEEGEASKMCKSGAFFGSGALANFTSVMLLLMNFLFFLPLTMFLGTLLLSNIRRYYLVCHYGLLVRVDTTTPPLEECPVLTTANPDNVRAWTRSFLALSHFGARYFHRMELYSRVCAVLLASFLLWIYLHAMALSGGGGSGGNSSGAEEEDDEGRGGSGGSGSGGGSGRLNPIVLDVRFFYSVVLLFLWGGFFAAVLGIIAATNEELTFQELCWLNRRLGVRETAHDRELNGSRRDRGQTLSRRRSRDAEEGAVAEEKGEGLVRRCEPEKAAILAIEGAEVKSVGHSDDHHGSRWSDNDDDPSSNIHFVNNFVRERALEQCGADDVLPDDVRAPVRATGATPKAAAALAAAAAGEEESTGREEQEGRERIAAAEADDKAEDEAEAAAEAAAQRRECCEELDDLYEAAAATVEAQNRVDPLKFLGLPGSWGLLSSFCALWAALIGLLLSFAGLDYKF